MAAIPFQLNVFIFSAIEVAFADSIPFTRDFNSTTFKFPVKVLACLLTVTNPNPDVPLVHFIPPDKLSKLLPAHFSLISIPNQAKNALENTAYPPRLGEEPPKPF